VDVEGIDTYVALSRIEELKALSSADYDVSKLIRMCEELNVCWSEGCLLAVAALTRTILDHVSPIFQCSGFTQVASNYGGGKSFKKSMGNLEKSLRNIADRHLHQHIRKSETLPTRKQVDFHADLDVLLEEIVRLLK